MRSEKMAMTTPVQMDRGSGAMSRLGDALATFLRSHAEPMEEMVDVYGHLQWNKSSSKQPFFFEGFM